MDAETTAPRPSTALRDRTADSSAGPQLAELFPPLGLRVTAGDLTLRLLRDEDLPAYAALVAGPVFEDLEADHVFGWYRAPVDERVRGGLQFHWSARATLSPAHWTLCLGVFRDERLIGQQDVSARDFARRRVVTSGSWLTRDLHGRGYGALMRRAMLVLAFDHLGARRAESAATLGNERSYRVSRACGYEADGTEVEVDGDRVVTRQRFALTPEQLVRPAVPVEVTGLTPALRTMLGAPGHAGE